MLIIGACVGLRIHTARLAPVSNELARVNRIDWMGSFATQRRIWTYHNDLHDLCHKQAVVDWAVAHGAVGGSDPFSQLLTLSDATNFTCSTISAR